MLKQEYAEENSGSSVSQARVTPEELTEALATIDARRQADAKTIPIEQAISELHLDSTSDEIWAEVLAQRAKARSVPPQEIVPTQIISPTQTLSPTRSRRLRGWPAFIIPLAALWFIGSTVLPTLSHHTPAAAPILRPLAQEPDGKTVYADDAALTQISEGKAASRITVSENATGNRWPLLKRDGHIYLHGYIASADALKPLAGKPLDVYNNDNSGGLEGESTSKITLRVDQNPLQQSGGDDGYSEVTIPNFQPDPLTTLSDWR